MCFKTLSEKYKQYYLNTLPQLTDIRMCFMDGQLARPCPIVHARVAGIHKISAIFTCHLTTCCHNYKVNKR